jgi:hypothetical protein
MKRVARPLTLALVLMLQLVECKSRSGTAASVMVDGNGFTVVIFPSEKKLHGFFSPYSPNLDAFRE